MVLGLTIKLSVKGLACKSLLSWLGNGSFQQGSVHSDIVGTQLPFGDKKQIPQGKLLNIRGRVFVFQFHFVPDSKIKFKVSLFYMFHTQVLVKNGLKF